MTTDTIKLPFKTTRPIVKRRQHELPSPSDLLSIVCFIVIIASISIASGPANALDKINIAPNQSDSFLESCTISPALIALVGQRIWRNECQGTIEGLTSWNNGENFPSLGIGHFIWYPKGVEGPFQESFPALLEFLQKRGVKLPAWLIKAQAEGCPWPDKQAFEADRNSPRMKELRQLLAKTISLQAEFIARRLAAALPAMLENIPKEERNQLLERFKALFATPDGLYAMMDYVNFKGEGVKVTERYAGQGWGLLQVLQEMKGFRKGSDVVSDFVEAAVRVLKRRVANAPPERQEFEKRWLPGWCKRVQGYLPASSGQFFNTSNSK